MKISQVLFPIFLLIGCTQNKTQVQILEECVDSFATAYFNYQFREAAKHVDIESEKWLQFAATNVTQEDVDMLKAQELGATVTIDNITFEDAAETQANIVVTAKNFLLHDSIGKSGKIVEEGVFKLKAYQENGSWRIRMESPLQNEK